MSHSTHIGLSFPPTWPERVSLCLPVVFTLAGSLPAWDAVIVGHILTAVSRLGFPLAYCVWPFDPSLATGVGHIFTAPLSFMKVLPFFLW